MRQPPRRRRRNPRCVRLQGRDKYENEDLIRWAMPHDIWFHVDALSSAHVYLRLPPGVTIATIDPDTLEDAAQLVKANSIQGNKQNHLEIVYTPAANLRKTASMDVGQVGFIDQKAVHKVRVERRWNDIVNRLNKTKEELYPNLEQEREAWEREERGRNKEQAQAARAAEKEAAEEQRRAQEAQSYKGVLREEDMVTVRDMREKYQRPEDYEDDFM
jgi:hypothetical protein